MQMRRLASCSFVLGEVEKREDGWMECDEVRLRGWIACVGWNMDADLGEVILCLEHGRSGSGMIPTCLPTAYGVREDRFGFHTVPDVGWGSRRTKPASSHVSFPLALPAALARPAPRAGEEDRIRSLDRDGITCGVWVAEEWPCTPYIVPPSVPWWARQRRSTSTNRNGI